MGVTRIKQATEATVTSVGKGPGTIPYMAPEMFQKARRGTPVDIYSLGCTLSELFGGQRVWPSRDATEIMMLVCGSYKQPPQMPSFVYLDPIYCNVCEKCCQLDASSRPQIEDVVKLIDNISNS